MIRKAAPVCLLLLLAVLAFLWPQPSQARPLPPTAHVVRIDVHDTLQPVRARVFSRQIRDANRAGVRAILIDLSTPGGLSQSTDQMVAAMRQSRVPIIVWAGQTDTRISGEGLRLVAEADVALMSYRTYLTPLWTELPRGLTAQERHTGSQRLLTELAASVSAHHRNPSALDELTSGLHWFTAPEARQAGFVDGIAETESDVLHLVQGRSVTRAGRTTTLDVDTLGIEGTGSNMRELLLLSLMNPDLSVLLLTLGLLLVYLEINTPGIVVPGAAGVLLILLAAFSLSSLPLSIVGILLSIAALLLLLLEARFHVHGVFATLGVAALVGGLGMLVDGPLPEMEVSWATAIGAGLGFGGVTACLIVLGLQARRAKVKTGSEAMLGWLAIAQTPLNPEGQILIRGELWKARLSSLDSTVAAGGRVKVIRADGLTLEVTAVPLG